MSINEQMISVEVAYATPELQKIIKIQIPENSSLQQAILQSGILAFFPSIDLDQMQVGVWGQIKSLQTVAVDGDRIEIYRALTLDPRQARLLRASLKR